MKTFYPDDPNLSDRDKEIVERSLYLMGVMRKLMKTFADNSKCKRQLYINKFEPKLEQDVDNAKCASHLYTIVGLAYQQLTHDIRFNNCTDDYIIACNKLSIDVLNRQSFMG